jgi:protein required for attachment to host cells
MTNPSTIPHDGLILVGDGKKALFLRNEGDAKFWRLVVECIFANRNPLTHEQGANRPGRIFKEAVTHRRSSMETTDWHELGKRRFARDVADAMAAWISKRDVPAIIIVAPARILAELRDKFCDAVKERVVMEIAKDLTKHPISDIERHLLGEMGRSSS